MKHFGEVLQTLGASNIELLHESKNWDFWKVDYQTPISTTHGYYLYLKHRCKLREATPYNKREWLNFSEGYGYELVVTPRSPLTKNIENTKKIFRAEKINISSELLRSHFLKDIILKPELKEEYFLDPDISTEENPTIHTATNFLASWLTDKEIDKNQKPIAILVADGGVGKTTLTRMLCNKLQEEKSPLVIPILIESEQWRHLMQSTITLSDLWDLAISSRFEHPTKLLSNNTALRVLIQEGIFVVIFDGFDELCINPASGYNPQDIIDELISVLTPEDDVFQARILLTARKTFWQSISDDVDDEKVEIFNLKPFDNEQRKKYFYSRLSLPMERDIALRISKQISGGLYVTVETEGLNENKLSGVPFILDLIAQYVQDNSDVDTNPYEGDHLAKLLKDICKRENKRQSLDISPSEQLILFEELFRDFQKNISIENLKLYLEIICDVSSVDVIQRFTNHVFLVRTGPETYSPRYEVLRVYFVARFIANGLVELFKKGVTSDKSKRKDIIEKLAENSSGKTQVMDWLVLQLNNLEESILIEAIWQAIDIINEKEKDEVRTNAALALFHLIISLISPKLDKDERSRKLFNYFRSQSDSSNLIIFSNVFLTGLIKAFNFSNIIFKNCFFHNVEFRNCRFNNNTIIQDSNFSGILSFNNCASSNDINLQDCKYSDEAEYAISKIKNTGINIELRKKFAEDVLNRALKKLRKNYGFISIQYRYRNSGFKPGNPYNTNIWDYLLKHNIVQRHEISNVNDGGLHIIVDKDLRKEINSFLDNAILGKRLESLIEDLVA